mgnify:CR=1 FL=1
MDLVSPLPKTEGKSIPSGACGPYLPKWAEAFPLEKYSADEVAKRYVEEVTCRFGAPEILLTDRRKQFIGTLVSNINFLLSTRKPNV